MKIVNPIGIMEIVISHDSCGLIGTLTTFSAGPVVSFLLSGDDFVVTLVIGNS